MIKSAGKILLFGVLLGVCLFLAFVAVNPTLRQRAQTLLNSKERVVLSAVWGHFVENEPPLKAVKAQDARGVFIEVFTGEEGKELHLLTTIMTGDPHDGQFNYKGHMSRLVAADVDQDGVDELLVPTFDSSMRPNLSVYKYQPSTKEFQKVTTDL